MEPEYHHLLPRSSLPRVSASESSDTHCAVPLCYLFPSQVYAAHTHIYTQLVPSFDCHNTAVSSPLFLLLSTANSLRFQLQTLVRPFLIIFQLPSAVFVCHSPLPSQGRDNFSPLSLEVSNIGEIFATIRGEECGGDVSPLDRPSSRFAISTNPRIEKREKGGEDETKLIEK